MLLFALLLLLLLNHLAVVLIDIACLFLVVRLLRRCWGCRRLTALDNAGAPITDAVVSWVRAHLGRGAQLRESVAVAAALAALCLVRLVFTLTSGIVQIGSAQP